jgi:hypothetical protein
MEEHRIPEKEVQETDEKPSKRWEDGVRENAVMLLGIRARKTEAKDRESWRQYTEEVKARYGL